MRAPHHGGLANGGGVRGYATGRVSGGVGPAHAILGPVAAQGAGSSAHVTSHQTQHSSRLECLTINQSSLIPPPSLTPNHLRTGRVSSTRSPCLPSLPHHHGRYCTHPSAFFPFGPYRPYDDLSSLRPRGPCPLLLPQHHRFYLYVCSPVQRMNAPASLITFSLLEKLSCALYFLLHFCI